MSIMAEMDIVISDIVDLIIDGNGISESTDAMISHYDLTDGEKRSIIYFLAQRGYRYTNKGA